MIAKDIREVASGLRDLGYHITIETAATVPPEGIACDLACLPEECAHALPKRVGLFLGRGRGLRGAIGLSQGLMMRLGPREDGVALRSGGFIGIARRAAELGQDRVDGPEARVPLRVESVALAPRGLQGGVGLRIRPQVPGQDDHRQVAALDGHAQGAREPLPPGLQCLAFLYQPGQILPPGLSLLGSLVAEALVGLLAAELVQTIEHFLPAPRGQGGPGRFGRIVPGRGLGGPYRRALAPATGRLQPGSPPAPGTAATTGGPGSP